MTPDLLRGLTPTAEMLAITSFVMTTLAALFAFLAFARSGRRKDEPLPLSKFDAMQLLRTETDSLKTASDERERRLGKRLEDQLTRVSVEADQKRDALRKLVEEKLDDSTGKQANVAREVREEINGSLQGVGRTVSATLEQSSQQQKERLDDIKKALDGQTEQAGKAQETLRQAVEGRLDAIRLESASKLDEMRLAVDEKLQSTLETRMDQSFARIVEQMTKIYEQVGEMKTLAASVGSLNNAITNVKVRGTFGEVQLAMLLDEFLTPDQYVKNAQVRENGAERVEYAIKFKAAGDGEDILLPVDAKFPREDYERLVEASEAGDAQLMARFRKFLENRIRVYAKDIRDKCINPPRTTDFAVMFLPTESLYAEALRQPGLFEYLQRECHVTLAGPTTFSAILNAFRMNFHSLALAKQTTEIWRVLSAVRTEFSRYNRVVGSLDRQLRAASNSVESLGRRTEAMDRKLRTVATLPDRSAAERLLGLEDDNIGLDDEEEFTNGHSPTPTDLNEPDGTLPHAAE